MGEAEDEASGIWPSVVEEIDAEAAGPIPKTSPDVGDVFHLIQESFHYLRPYWREHIILVVTVIFPVVLGICLPLSLRVLIDQAIGKHNLTLLLDVLAGLSILLLLSAMAEVIQVYVRAQFGSELKKDLRLKLFRQLQRLPISYFDSVEPGEITALFATEVITLRAAWRNLTIRGFRACLQLVVTWTTMIVLNWRMSVVLAVLLVITVKIQRSALSRSEIADFDDKIADAKVAFAVQDNVASFGMIRAFGLGDQAVQKFQEVALGRKGPAKTINNLDREAFRKGFRSPTYLKSMVVVWANIQQTIVYLCALCIGSWLTFEGILTVGTFSALLALFVGLGQAIASLSAFLQDLVSASTALLRIERVLNLEADVKDAPNARELPRLDGKIAFHNVCFGYKGMDLQLKNLSFELPGKGAVAFVGRSGCGKSTVMKLMLRFYDPLSGSVSLGGNNLAEIRLASLRGHVGVVLQELILFNATVRDNICVVRPQASDAEIEAAARAAEIHSSILEFPQGYQTLVGEGGKRLSPGQRQRIALARALLADPAVLILDEITSALDPETEAAVQETLRKLARDRTIVLLTHRLSSARHLDHVVVMDKGVVVQQGTPQVLLSQPGLFRQFWQIQSGFVVSQDGRRAEITAERLQAIPLFADIPIEALGKVAGRFLTDYFEAGETICREGQVGDRFFIIVRGRVQVLAAGRAQDSPLHLAYLEDGDYFGEDAMLDKTAYTTAIEVEIATLVLYLKRSDFKKLMKTTKRLRQSMEETALGRSLTLVGRRGRLPSRLPAWDALLDDREAI